ncbi:MAG: calcium/sodium antiporter [Tissierellia bacterium]|nr:calcium/sodium antiporter [Tissierellia bacterium]
MEISLVILFFAIGLIMTVKGGDLFVDAAIWIAEKTGISSGIIGATIVSMATTLPELFVSTVASNEGFSEMAIGNAIGSYICNIAFIIGICSLIRPIKIKDKFFGIKGTMMIGYLCIFFLFSKDGFITFKEGYLLVLLQIFFVFLNILEHRRESTYRSKNKGKYICKKDLIKNGVKFIVGILLIIYGAHILVDSGVEIAKALRIPKQVVSLTLLAIGTSIPEFVTSIVAILKGQQNISLGNILGANIINISIVVGISTLVSDKGLIVTGHTLFTDIPMAMLVSFLFVLVGLLNKKIGRLTGLILLGAYITYLFILF